MSNLWGNGLISEVSETNSEPCQTFHGAFWENIKGLLTVDYFCKTFHLRCLTEFWNSGFMAFFSLKPFLDYKKIGELDRSKIFRSSPIFHCKSGIQIPQAPLTFFQFECTNIAYAQSTSFVFANKKSQTRYFSDILLKDTHTWYVEIYIIKTKKKVYEVTHFFFIRISSFFMSLDILNKFITLSLKIFLTYSYAKFLFQIM